MFTPELLKQAEDFLNAMRKASLRIATAESCTGGLISGLLTEIPGSSDIVDRGFVTYSNKAKTALLGVPPELLKAQGAVSEDVVRAMVGGALRNSVAQIAIAVSGVAGPGGGTPEKPIGRVHIAAANAVTTLHMKMDYSDLGRSEVRLRTIQDAIGLASQLIN